VTFSNEQNRFKDINLEAAFLYLHTIEGECMRLYRTLDHTRTLLFCPYRFILFHINPNCLLERVDDMKEEEYEQITEFQNENVTYKIRQPKEENEEAMEEIYVALGRILFD
jgi:hypothetical protein